MAFVLIACAIVMRIHCSLAYWNFVSRCLCCCTPQSFTDAERASLRSLFDTYGGFGEATSGPIRVTRATFVKLLRDASIIVRATLLSPTPPATSPSPRFLLCGTALRLHRAPSLALGPPKRRLTYT